MHIFISLTIACLILAWISSLAHSVPISILCIIAQVLIGVAEVAVIYLIDKNN